MVIENTREFSVRCFKPAYADQKGVEYTPWFIGHRIEDSLSDEALTALYNDWVAHGGLEACEDSPASGFAAYIETRGYVVFWSPENWLWTLPVTQDDLEACEARAEAVN